MLLLAIPLALVAAAVYFAITDEKDIKWIPMMPEVSKYQRYAIAVALFALALIMYSFTCSSSRVSGVRARVIEGLTGQPQQQPSKRCTIKDMLEALDEASEVSSVSGNSKDHILQPQDYDEVMSQISSQSSLTPELTRAFERGTF